MMSEDRTRREKVKQPDLYEKKKEVGPRSAYQGSPYRGTEG